MEKLLAIVGKIWAFVEATGVPEQLQSVDVAGLFSNPWFLVPFLLVLCYLLYRQAFTDIAVLAIGGGLWAFSGSSYMKGLIVNGELDIGKILPVAGVWIGGLAVIIYLIFIRSD